MNKVIVIGSPGAGKSTFSRRLEKITGIPLIHLDNIWHMPDKTHITREEFDLFLENTFKQDRWIMDGDYSRTLKIRFENADTVFFLDYPKELCLEGIRQRLGKKRDDMPWVESRLDGELIAIVESYPDKNRKFVCELIENHKNDKFIYIFRAREEADKYLNRLSQDNR